MSETPERRRYRIRWVDGPWAWWRARDDYPQGYILRYRFGPFLLRVMVG